MRCLLVCVGWLGLEVCYTAVSPYSTPRREQEGTRCLHCLLSLHETTASLTHHPRKPQQVHHKHVVVFLLPLPSSRPLPWWDNPPWDACTTLTYSGDAKQRKAPSCLSPLQLTHFSKPLHNTHTLTTELAVACNGRAGAAGVGRSLAVAGI